MLSDHFRRFFKKIFHVYRERLYTICFEDVKTVIPKINVSFKRINNENYFLAKALRGAEYEKEFKKMLDMKDIGLYVYADGKPVGYGWAKLPNSKDHFYIISDCYLCSFFITPKYRGLGIFPYLIKEVMSRINKEYGINQFYVAAAHKNNSSIKGITKVGFKFLKENNFVRCCKVTFNKAHLN